MKIINIIITTLLLLSAWVSAKQVPIEAFSAGFDYSQVKLSPTGEYLSFTSEVEGKNGLIIFDLQKSKIINIVKLESNAEVGHYEWVNDERLVFAKHYLRGWTDHPQYYGELFGINADGSGGRYLVGYRGEMQTGSHIKKAKPLKGTSYILDPLINDPKHLLIFTIPWTSSKEPKTRVYKVNVKTGVRKSIARSPSRMADFLTDHQGQVRVSLSTDDRVNQTIHLRERGKKKWQEFKLQLGLTDINLHAFDVTGNKIYITASQAGEAKGIYELDLRSGKTVKLLQDKEVSPKKLWIDDISRELYAVELEPGYPTYAFIDNDAKMSKRLKNLIAALPGEQISIVSTTKAADKSVVFAFSDTNPGSYYLYQAESNKLQFLFHRMKDIDYRAMAKTQPISFKSRDGLDIHGYLTLPHNKEAKNLPLVVLPHGGPHGVRDWWGFDPETQLLANRGIAVLKVNFRGSGGYGREFEHAGHKKWGSAIQHDIIDATKYVIEQGYANPNNMCIMGASFGGYSALQSSIIEPDMFKCAIGVIGIYDLPMLFEEGDVAEIDSGQKFLSKILGTDEAKLKAYSPSYNIDKLKVPVLIVHGGDDERAPIEQAESLIDALKKAKHPYEYMLLENEGHGFYKPEHRTKYYKRVLAFLDEHLML
ncbi:peptidase S9 [Pseudoalteromonas phenolica]|uniref:Peptidase S9 n=1 Tax=Pseudoalteromonas phenolica TaxID=161398 RepID=A0A5S3YSZ3_9GAMM|nr:S9 family peptidase [Pseudoalteromonas phenolica]TMP80509.1 peptidase S9 [Pseudoalteromonas phenolica]